MSITDGKSNGIWAQSEKRKGARLSAMLGTGAILVAALLIWVPWAEAQPVQTTFTAALPQNQQLEFLTDPRGGGRQSIQQLQTSAEMRNRLLICRYA